MNVTPDGPTPQDLLLLAVGDHTRAASQTFAALQRDLLSTLPTLVKDIQHIGGTAVAGLIGRATVDVLLITHSLQAFDQQRSTLSQLNFLSIGDGGNSSQRVFALGAGADTDKDANSGGVAACTSMLYVCEPGAPSALHHLLLRDYLRSNPDERDSYSALKQRLAEQHAGNPPRYVAGKRPRLKRLLDRATGRR